MNKCEAFYNGTVLEMAFDDLRHILRLYLGVPNAVGINQNRGSDGTKADGTAVRQNDLTHRISPLRHFSLPQTFRLKYLLESCLDLGTADSRARLPVTDKNMMLYWSPSDRSKPLEFAAVTDKFRLRHNNIHDNDDPDLWPRCNKE